MKRNQVNRNGIFFACLIAFFSLTFGGCRAYISTSASGKADVSYILLLRDYDSHVKTATIQLDGQTPVVLSNIQKEVKSHKAKPYPIAPGKHHLKVMVEGKTLVDEKIFLGVQETKKIIIPCKKYRDTLKDVEL